MIKRIHLTKKVRRLVLIIAALVILIAAACYTVFIKPNLNTEQWIYKESPVTLGDLTVGVTESGSLEYGITAQSYDISIDTTDSSDTTDDTTTDTTTTTDDTTTEKYLKIEDVFVVIGQRISEGDALLKFTDDSIADVRRILQSAKTEAEIAYAEAKSQYDLDALTSKQTYESSNIENNYAGEIYNATIAEITASISEKSVEIESLNKDITDLNNSIEDATDNLADAKEAYDDSAAIYDSVDQTNTLVFIPYKIQLENLKSQYESAQSKLDQIYSDIETKQENITQLQDDIIEANAKLAIEKLTAKQTYETSKAGGQTAKSIYDNSLASLQETLDSAKQDVTDATEQLDAFEAFVGDGTIYAEGAGIVTEVDYEADDSLITQGTMVAYAKSDEMTLAVDVSQEDVISLAVGDTVNIAFTAYPDVAYEGIISAITTTATSTSSATVSYPVTIMIQGDTSALYGGMTADITFVTDYKDQVLYISKKAIVDQDGKTYVYIKDSSNNYVLKEVTTGMSNGISVEITDGLTQDDIVYIATKVTESASETESATDTTDTTGTTTDSTTTDTTGTTTDTTTNTSTDSSQTMPGGTPPDMSGSTQNNSGTGVTP